MMQPSAERRGVVLAAALLVLLAVEAISLALLFIVAHDALVARAHDRSLHLRLAAENAAVAAARLVIAAPPADRLQPDEVIVFPLAERYTEPDDSAADGEALPARMVTMLVAESWIVLLAEARDATAARGRATLLLARPDPLRFRTLFGDSIRELDAAMPAGEPPDADADPAAVLLAELRQLSALPGAAQPLRLYPRTDVDACVAAVDNWGAPLQPGHPCATHFIAATIDDATTVAQGSGQGILVVNGRLVLEAGSSFHGAILVAGELAVAEGATVTGAISRLPGARLALDGTFVGDEARVLAALSGATALRRAVRARRLWLPVG
jgi:hypothetical protein